MRFLKLNLVVGLVSSFHASCGFSVAETLVPWTLAQNSQVSFGVWGQNDGFHGLTLQGSSVRITASLKGINLNPITGATWCLGWECP